MKTVLKPQNNLENRSFRNRENLQNLLTADSVSLSLCLRITGKGNNSGDPLRRLKRYKGLIIVSSCYLKSSDASICLDCYKLHPCFAFFQGPQTSCPILPSCSRSSTCDTSSLLSDGSTGTCMFTVVIYANFSL